MFRKEIIKKARIITVTKGLLRLYQVRQSDVIPIVVGPESKRRKFLFEIKKIRFTPSRININSFPTKSWLNYLRLLRNSSILRKDYWVNNS